MPASSRSPSRPSKIRWGRSSEEDVNAWKEATEDPEAAVLDHYKRFKATRYDVPKQVCARHILVRSPKEVPPDVREGHRKRITEAAKKVSDGKMTFEEAAAEYSDDSNKTKGGDLGCFGPGQMVPKFEEAAFGMEKNTTSSIIETMFGFHVIQVYDVKDPIRRKLEEVEDEIRQELAKTTKANRLARKMADKLIGLGQEKGSLEGALEQLKKDEDEAKLPKLIAEGNRPHHRSAAFHPEAGPRKRCAKTALGPQQRGPHHPEASQGPRRMVCIRVCKS